MSVGSFFKRNRFLIEVISTVVFLLAASLHWYAFFEEDEKHNMLGGIVFGVLGLIKLYEVITEIKNRKLKT